MINLRIEYNPYLIKTKFILNDKPIKAESGLNNFIDKKLQIWISKLYPILKKENSFKELRIAFKGRKIDFNDLVAIYKNNSNIFLEHIPILESEDRLKKLKKLFEKIQKGPYEELKSLKVKEYFEKAFSSEFEIGVVATVSSGKSTLLNSILGKDLIPAKNQACTAKISKIYNENKKDHFSGKGFIDGNLIKSFPILTQEDLVYLNENPEINRVEIFGKIKNINSNENKLVLIDTPGPNNANDLRHKELTYELIAKDYKPLILYVLNYQQLGITDDKKLLEDIGNAINESGDAQNSERFIFVLNKFDSKFESTNDDPIEKTIETAKKYLESVGIYNPVIIPTSAMTALLIREEKYLEDKKMKRIRNNKIADLIESYEDEEFNINNYMEIPNSIIEKINQNLKDEVDDEKKAELLSGVPALEEYIDEYLSKYALPEKIQKATGTFENFIKKEDIQSKMFTAIQQNEEEIEKMKKSIEKFENNYTIKIPQIRKELEKYIKNIEIGGNKKIEDYEIKIEVLANKLRKNKENSSSSVSGAMQPVKKYISELQSEYLKLKTEMDQEIKKILDLEVKKLIQFYEKEVKSISDGNIDKNISNTIKTILNLNIKDKINFDEKKLEEILEKTRT